jgi:DNA polymerase IV
MHIDINSCFATIEQQSNPLLRNKPVVVAASANDYGCILAASVDAKKYGIKTGMRIKEAKLILPSLIALTPNPDKYRSVHHALKNLLSIYTPDLTPKSIDEFSLNFSSVIRDEHPGSIIKIAQEIKQKIKTDIGEYITVSIGIGANRFLAKTGAGLHKPDGLDIITTQNIQAIFNTLELTDICGISVGNAIRLHQVGINTAQQFLNAPLYELKRAFRSIAATYWFMRLRGWEIDDFSSRRKSFSHSYVLPQKITVEQSIPILIKLVHQLTERLRQQGYQAQNVYLSVINPDHRHWHQAKQLSHPLVNANDFIHAFLRLSRHIPFPVIKKITVACTDLKPIDHLQFDLFEINQKNYQITQAMDQINARFGDCTLFPAAMVGSQSAVPDAIGFGRL